MEAKDDQSAGRPRSPKTGNVPVFSGRWYELDKHRETWQPLLEAAESDNITLLFSARDTEHNNAVVLQDYLEEQLRAGAK